MMRARSGSLKPTGTFNVVSALNCTVVAITARVQSSHYEAVVKGLIFIRVTSVHIWLFIYLWKGFMQVANVNASMCLCRLPGLESSKNNQVQEDAMYDTMMTALLRIVLQPVVPSLAVTGDGEKGLWEAVRAGSNTAADTEAESDVSSPGTVTDVTTPASISAPASPVPNNGWKNLLKWKAFTHANRQKILAEFA
jgi:hypothetical protein